MRWSAVRLIAAREVRERGRARSFQVTLVISVLIVVAAIVLPKVLAGSKGPARLGVVGSAQVGSASALSAALHHPVVVVAEPDATTARALVDAKKLDVAVIDDQVVMRVVPKATDTSVNARLATALATSLGEVTAFRAAGLTPAQTGKILSTHPVPITGLRGTPPNRDRQKFTTLVGIILLYSFVSLYGAWVLFGVVEEKSSRVVEILLATARSTELLTGKLLGIGVLALAQGAAAAAAAYIAALASGSNVLQGTNGTAILSMIFWFLLGYAFYASLFAAGGSLVGRQEEVQNVSFPISLPLLVAYLVSFTSLGSTPSTFEVVLSYLPPTAPISMPVRIAAGGVPAWQVAVSVALVLAGTVAVIRFAAVVYNRAILHTGSRLSWRAALRSSGV